MSRPGPSEPGLEPLVLASASPRRAEILATLGLRHEVVPSGVEETERPGETPRAHAERMAREKAEVVAVRRPDAWVLASDTVVAVEGEGLGKPRDGEEAVAMLLRLQGRVHEVASSLVLRSPAGEAWSGVEVTEVAFRPFGEETARAYAATGEPMDKAGAYGIQGLGSVLVERVSGDHSGVVGLPVSLLVRLMEAAGRPYRFPPGP